MGETEHLEGHRYLEGHRVEYDEGRGGPWGHQEVLSPLAHCVLGSAFYLYILYYLLQATFSRF